MFLPTSMFTSKIVESKLKKCILEYVWKDSNDQLRSKIQVVKYPVHSIGDCPKWQFDGSSTGMSRLGNSGDGSDIVLYPVRLFNNPFIDYCVAYLVLCSCYMKDGTPCTTNTRIKCVKTSKLCEKSKGLFGLEQEYVLYGRDNLPLKWKGHNMPGIGGQGPYYCSTGGDRSFGRSIADEHLRLCLEAGIEICGTNAEVMASQWEYQIGVLPSVEVSDHLWMSRYILHRVTEKFDCWASLHPKPYHGKWNGSGCHTNFSTVKMREKEGIKFIYKACEKLKPKHKEHMKVYGKFNEERLSGNFETSEIDKFSYGDSDRGCSIRIPLGVVNNKCGYLEDRRPASNMDPYLVTEMLLNTICCK